MEADLGLKTDCVLAPQKVTKAVVQIEPAVPSRGSILLAFGCGSHVWTVALVSAGPIVWVKRFLRVSTGCQILILSITSLVTF